MATPQGRVVASSGPTGRVAPLPGEPTKYTVSVTDARKLIEQGVDPANILAYIPGPNGQPLTDPKPLDQYRQGGGLIHGALGGLAKGTGEILDGDIAGGVRSIWEGSPGGQAYESAKDQLDKLGLTPGAIDTAGLDKDTQAARDLRQRFLADLDATGPRAAPMAEGTQMGPIERIAATQIGAPREVGASQIGPVTDARAATLGPAAQAQAATLGPAAQAQASTIDPAVLATAARIRGEEQEQFRARQLGLVQGLEDTIAGKAPSVAEIQLRDAADRNIAQQYAMAASARGQNIGLAQRGAAQNAAGIGAQLGRDASLLRAQEIAQARGLLGGVLAQGRDSDINLATNQAGLEQQATLANANAQNTRAINQAQLGTQVSLGNAGMTNEQARAAATLQTNVNVANAGMTNEQARAGAQLQTQTEIANAAARNAAAIRQAELEQQAATGNADRSLTADTSNATLQQQAAIANQTAYNAQQQHAAQLAQQIAIANQQAQQTQTQLDDQREKAMRDAALTAQGQTIEAGVGKAGIDLKNREAALDTAKAVGQAVAFVSSDERGKTDIAAADVPVRAFLDDLEAKTFRYRRPDRPGAARGRRFGVMAQDLERNPVGRSLVRDTEQGKVIDLPQGLGVFLAALGNINRRVARVEKKAA